MIEKYIGYGPASEADAHLFMADFNRKNLVRIGYTVVDVVVANKTQLHIDMMGRLNLFCYSKYIWESGAAHSCTSGNIAKLNTEETDEYYTVAATHRCPTFSNYFASIYKMKRVEQTWDVIE